LTGGEPLLREDYPAIHRHALEKGIMVAVFTNGTLIDRKAARFFRDYPPFCMDITLPGITRETYEKVSGRRGSWEQCREAIRLLHQYRVPFRLKTVVSTLNQSELPRIKAFARRLKVEHRFDALICRRLDGGAAPARFRLPPAEIVRLDRRDGEKWEEFVEYACRSYGASSSRRLYRCGGGVHSFHVTADGKLTLCALETRHAYDLARGSFTEGWETFIPRVRSIESAPGNLCASCEAVSLCGNCPAWSALETGSPDQSSEFRCQVARRRCRLLEKDGRIARALGKKKEALHPD
jgi:radical SAM protein with 4Fe4S-binding SPASM domain